MRSRLAILTAALAGFFLGLAFIVGVRELRIPGSSEVSAAPSTTAEPDTLLPQALPPDPTIQRRTPVVEAVARTAPAVLSMMGVG